MLGEQGNLDAANDTRIPILVGITGHRDVQDELALREEIKGILLDICKKYESSPVVLLTPLAEGADRIAARAVIELRKNNISRINYKVVLPMGEEEYIETFQNKESIEEYKALKDEALGCNVIPVNDSMELDSTEDREIRHKKLYTNLGIYLALNTQILIAAWNGEEEALNCCRVEYEGGFNNVCLSDGALCTNFIIKPGGTYHVLRMRFFGTEEEYKGKENFLSNREFGPVYWIKTERKSSPYVSEGIKVLGPSYPDYPIDYSKYAINRSNLGDSTEKRCIKLVVDYFQNQKGQMDSKNSTLKTYEEILCKLNDYNRDINRNYISLENEIKTSHKYFTTHFYMEGGIKKEEVFHFGDIGDKLIGFYTSADVLSICFQKKRKRDIVSLITMAFFAMLSFNLYTSPATSSWLIVSYSMIYLLGILYYLHRVKVNRYHERYVDYRGIAEGLRVQFFWNLIGIKTRVSEEYLTKQKSSINWVRIAINNVSLLYQSEQSQENDSLNYKDGVVAAYKLWLLNQHDYYNRKCPEKDRTVKFQDKAERILFALGLSVAVLLTILDTYEFITTGAYGLNKMFLPLRSDSDYVLIHGWFIFIIGFLPVMLASYKVFTELSAYSKLARNFNYMRMVYSIGLYEFMRISSSSSNPSIFVERSRKLFHDIGVEALLENGEWIGIFDERAPQMPT